MPKNDDNPRRQKQTIAQLQKTQRVLAEMARTLDIAIKTMKDADLKEIEVDGVTMLPTYIQRIHNFVGYCEKEIYLRS